MSHVVGYTRVSTTLQALDGVSLDAQREAIGKWCGALGYALPSAAFHVDAGLSGGRADNRPALQAALAAVCRRGGILVVYSLSRLARSTRDTLAIVDRLEKAGADLVSLSERIDTTSAAGKMVFRMLAVLAEFEKDLVSERTRAALQHKRSRGERVGNIPLGSHLAGDGRTLTPDGAELATLALIRRLRDKGRSPARIARVLDRLRVPTKTGRPKWARQVIARILQRESTVHEHVNGQVNDQVNPPADPPGTGE